VDNPKELYCYHNSFGILDFDIDWGVNSIDIPGSSPPPEAPSAGTTHVSNTPVHTYGRKEDTSSFAIPSKLRLTGSPHPSLSS